MIPNIYYDPANAWIGRGTSLAVANTTKPIALRPLASQYIAVGGSPTYYPAFTLDPSCFLADAPVLTPTGCKAIASLNVGDLVTTATGDPMAIKRIIVQAVTPDARTLPCVVPVGLYGATERLLISQHHQIRVNPTTYKEARFLGLDLEPMNEPFTYYNLELVDQNADIIIAGVVVETWKEWDGVERFA